MPKRSIMRIIFILLFTISITLSFAQSQQSEYLEAKRQFTLGNYRDAMGGFRALTDDPVLGAYASFYYGLSAFNHGMSTVAIDMWKQTLIKYPRWDQKEEINYWISYAAFSAGNLREGFQYADQLSPELRTYLVPHFLQTLDLETLTAAYEADPENEEIATYLSRTITAQPYQDRDYPLLLSLAEKFDIELASSGDTPLVKKDTYGIAVVLPFMFESIEQPQAVIRNSIIFDLYQGMELARDELAENNIQLELFPFDTHKDGEVTQQFLSDSLLNRADAIIGPLYPGPNRLIREFSREKEIPMINPVSSNAAIIGENPYAFLFKPSYATQGRSAAEYAIRQFTENKKAYVFFDTERDSIVADAYRESIENAGFHVLRYERLTNESALQLQNEFTERYEERLDSLYTEEQVDSVALIPGRFVRSRLLRDEETGKVVLDEEEEEVMEYYEMKLTVEKDTIGHIFAATSSNLLANNLISLIDVRGDSIGLIGYHQWLDFKQTSYRQMERLQIAFIHTSFYPSASPALESVKRRFAETLKKEPGEYHLLGYELIMQIGRLMNEHGKYFQRGLADGIRKEGILMEGLKYGPYNDNQVVPIITLENLRPQNRNTELYKLLQSEKEENED